MDVAKPHEFIGFGAMGVTKPCEFMRFGSRSNAGGCVAGPPAVLRSRITSEVPGVSKRTAATYVDDCQNLAVHWQCGIFIFAGFRPSFGQTWSQSPCRTSGLVLQSRLHQKSAPQNNSKANSRFSIPTRQSAALLNVSPWSQCSEICTTYHRRQVFGDWGSPSSLGDAKPRGIS